MSSGADGSDPCTGLDPGTIPELPAHEPPVLQAPSPAPQQEVVVASQTEAPLPAVTIVISRPGEDVQMPDAKGGSPACSPQAGDGKPMATSVSLTASAAAKEAGLARSDSDSLDDYEQCRSNTCTLNKPRFQLRMNTFFTSAEFVNRRQKNLWSTLDADVVVILQKHIAHALIFGFVLEVQTSVRYASRLLSISPLQKRNQVYVYYFALYIFRSILDHLENGWFSPLWVAFAILIGGLLLDVLISVSLGVSALPVNIIIGVLIVLGLGTALHLALECCHEWGSRRNVANIPRLENIAPTGYHPAVV
ncbi:RING/U-box superfamily protein [Zea mays]|uniref:RING/U-box superfamily protein n=1 Tax=Zea mays TaxID=4577 RepID=A0A1D6GPD0_MAIZE|nr:RING/U-box superfamily protein [Zea mays]